MMGTDSGPIRAFPLVTPDAEVYLGMTLRDYFAASIAGYLVAMMPSGPVPNIDSRIAERAYAIADAMVEARRHRS